MRDVSNGHISDYINEVSQRTAFIETVVSAFSDRYEAFPGSEELSTEAWMGFLYVVQDLSALTRAINQWAQKQS